MSSLFPLRRSVDLDDSREPRLVGMDEELADDVFEALAAGTTRRIFGHLHEDPHTASELADLTGTSVQNAQYHLGKLQDADLVEVVDTWYSERGTEMKVYAPTDESLVVFAGGQERGSLRELLKRAVAILAVLGPVAALLGWLAGEIAAPLGQGARHGQGDGGLATDGGGAGVMEAAGSASQEAASVDPALLAGVAFFLGGLFVLALVVGTWYWRQ